MAVFVPNSGWGVDTSQFPSLTFNKNTATVSKGYTEGFSKYIYQPTSSSSGLIPLFSGTAEFYERTENYVKYRLSLGNTGPQNFMEVGFLRMTFATSNDGAYWLYDLGQRISICLYLLQQGLIGNANTRFSQPPCFLFSNGIYKTALGSWELYTSTPSGEAMRVQIISEKQFYLYIFSSIYSVQDARKVMLSCNMTSFSVGSKMYN